jgi:hypothetical protein
MALVLKRNLRKMRTDTYNKRSRLYLSLGMHILRDLRESCLPKLQRKGSTASQRGG